MPKKRAHGEGTIFKLPNGKFRAQVSLGTDAKGKRKRKTFTSSKSEEVVVMLTEFRTMQTKGTLVATKRTTFEIYSAHWLKLKNPRVKATTYESYENTLGVHLNPYFGSRQIQKITTPMINEYFTQCIESEMSLGTIRRLKAILNNIFSIAISERVLSYNPVQSSIPISANINTKSKTKAPARILKNDEILQLVNAAKETYDKYRGKFGVFFQIYPLLLLALATGARRGELLALEWDTDVDFKESLIRINKNVVEIKGLATLETPKTENAHREVYVEKQVMDVLKDLKKVSRGKYVFGNRDGEYLKPSNASKAFRAIRDSLGITGVRFHDLRHTHASLLISEGIDYKTVSQRIGHSDIRTTLNLYTHTVPEKEKEAAEKMGSFLFGK